MLLSSAVPDLKIWVINACFHSEGICEFFSEKFIIYDRGCAISDAQSFKSPGGSSSTPVESFQAASASCCCLHNC